MVYTILKLINAGKFKLSGNLNGSFNVFCTQGWFAICSIEILFSGSTIKSYFIKLAKLEDIWLGIENYPLPIF